MTHYYVKTDGANDGTRTTGGFATQQTGAFSGLGGVSTYYPSIYAVTTGNSLTGSDVIYVSNLHDYTYSTQFNMAGISGLFVSVDDTAIDEYLAGASETCSGGYIAFQAASEGYVHNFKGIDFSAAVTLSFNSNSSKFRVQDATMAVEGLGDYFTYNGDGMTVEHTNCTFAFFAADTYFRIQDAAKLILDDCTFTSPAAINYMFWPYSVASCHVEVKNCDLSGSFISASTGLVKQINVGTQDRAIFIFERCKVNTNQVFHAPSIDSPSCEIHVYSCDAGNGYNYFEHQYYEGTVKQSLAVYRDNGATYDAINGFSAEYIPEHVNAQQEMRYELGTYELDLTTGAVLTFHLIINDSSQTGVPTALTNEDCWIEAVHPDATDNTLGKTVSTKLATVFTTPTTLTASTETWTGEEATHKRKHQISVTLPTVAMVDAPVAVSLCLAKNITTENSNEMFVCPLPIVT